MAEAKLDFTENKGYKNLNLKTKFKRNGKVLEFDENDEKIVTAQGIPDGDYVIIEKVMVDGKAIPSRFGGMNYTCKVKYNDEECSFFLTETEHSKFAAVGGIGDKVKITLKNELNKTTGVKDMQILYFEKVE